MTLSFASIKPMYTVVRREAGRAALGVKPATTRQRLFVRRGGGGKPGWHVPLNKLKWSPSFTANLMCSSAASFRIFDGEINTFCAAGPAHRRHRRGAVVELTCVRGTDQLDAHRPRERRTCTESMAAMVATSSLHPNWPDARSYTTRAAAVRMTKAGLSPQDAGWGQRDVHCGGVRTVLLNMGSTGNSAIWIPSGVVRWP